MLALARLALVGAALAFAFFLFTGYRTDALISFAVLAVAAVTVAWLAGRN